MDSTAEKNTALYQSCIAEAAAGGRPLMEKMVGSARQGLQQQFARSAGTERDGLTEMLRLLNHHEEALTRAYPAELMEAFSGADGGTRAKPAASALSFDELELMDETQVQESVEMARAQQAAQVATEAPLAVFNALICGAQGLKTVQPDRNPLRPECYVRALRTVLLQCGAPQGTRLRWLQFMGAALGRELADVYVALTVRLREGGVVPAGYAVTQTPHAAAAAMSAAGTGTPGTSTSGAGTSTSGAGTGQAGQTDASREDTVLTVRQLRRLLAGELDEAAAGKGSPASAPPRSDFNLTVPAAFEVLQEMKQVDKVMKRLADRAQPATSATASGPVSGAGLPLSALRAQLRTDARGVGQSLGLEVVNLMVENIASDPRLLPPLQQAVRALEPALLRLALIDPRFFSDKLHPARRLLEQMTQRSLAWKDAGTPAFQAFMEPLDQAVQVLANMPIESVEPFDFALKTLQEVWGEQQRRERGQRETAVKSLLQAEQRNLLAGKISKEIRGREDVVNTSLEMLEFLTGPWAQAMAQAKLSDKEGLADPGGYSAAINDLIWSAQPDLARNSIPRLTRLIPPLLSTLRDGLASIDYPPARAKAFFDGLMLLHQQALRPAAPAEAPRPATRAELDAKFDAEPWLAPAEAQDSGFMDTDMLDARANSSSSARHPTFEPTQAGFMDTQPYQAPRALQVEGEELIPAGTWVEFLVGNRSTRTQLTWASPHGTLFMFTNAEGGTHSMTRRSMDKLLADGGLRVVSDNAVVDEALNAVARTAMQNSLDIAL